VTRAARRRSLPPRPAPVFDDREGCPVCSGPPGTCVTDGDQEEHVDKAAWIRAYVGKRAKLQTVVPEGAGTGAPWLGGR
jgi:hypothetical protein